MASVTMLPAFQTTLSQLDLSESFSKYKQAKNWLLQFQELNTSWDSFSSCLWAVPFQNWMHQWRYIRRAQCFL